MKKQFRKAVIALLIISLFSCSVNASDIISTELINVSEDEAKNTAIDFLQDYTYNIYLYQKNDLESHTALSLSSNIRKSISAPSSNFAYFTQTRRISDELTLNDKSSYLLEKANYKTELHKIQNVVHTQFCVEYEVHNVNIIDNIAQVHLTEHKSFVYAGKDFDSSLSEIYEIFLIKSGFKWYVFDMICDDSFDGRYRTAEFDAEKAISDFAVVYSSSKTRSEQATTEITNAEPEAPVSPMAYYSGQSRTYNRDNAVNYAYTYSKSNTNDFLEYYNTNFWRIREGVDGFEQNADCMNFVSQCIYAGFYGSNDTASINGRAFPQDNDGTVSRWIAKPFGSYHAWTSISNFHKYLEECNSSTTPIEMSALQYTFPAVTASDSSGFTLSTPVSILGALVEVDGMVGSSVIQYGHAVLITHVEGSDRDELYYTAHTSDAKHVLFSSSYADDAVRVVIPVSMQELTSCSGGGVHTYPTVSASHGQDSTCSNCGYCKLYIKYNLLNCVPQGTTHTLTATTSQPVYRMAMKVTAPDGTVTWLGEVNNTSTYSANFTFTQTTPKLGLYEVTVYARDLNPDVYTDSSVSVYATFTVRCY